MHRVIYINQLKSETEQDLQDGKVLKYTVHHVLLWELFELENKVDHVLAHRRSVNSVNVTAIFNMTILRLRRTTLSALH